MISDQVMAAIHLTELVMAKEKQDRLGNSAALVRLIRLLFHGQNEIMGLMGGTCETAICLRAGVS